MSTLEIVAAAVVLMLVLLLVVRVIAPRMRRAIRAGTSREAEREAARYQNGAGDAGIDPNIYRWQAKQADLTKQRPGGF